MSSITILKRYVERGNCLNVPKDELRSHLAGVASRDKLVITEKDIDEVVFQTTGEKPKKRRNKKRKSNAGDNTAADDLKEIEKS